MNRVRYQSAVSIDGFIAPEDGSLDWLEPYNADGADDMRAFMKEIGGAIIGRTTFVQGLAMGGVAIFGKTPTLIMSSRPVERALPETMMIASGEPDAALAKLRAAMKSGDIWLMGGGATAARYLDAGLIDTIELKTVPVALGKGRSLFSGASSRREFVCTSVRLGKLGTLSSVYERR